MKKLRFLLATLLAIIYAANAQAQQHYAVLSSDNATLTFYYDDKMSSRSGSKIYDGADNERWQSHSETLTHIVFDASMGNCELTQMKFQPTELFNTLEKLTDIEGIGYLNTKGVETMSKMFKGCKSLQSLDLSHFNTSSVTDMSYMFYGCEKLEDLDVSGFNTANVTSMAEMFYRCSSLTSIDLSNFNTAKVNNMVSMFAYCSSLTYLNLSSFNTAKVTHMGGMFESCTKLATIFAGNNWSTESLADLTTAMFANCYNLQGGANTYSQGVEAADYAHIDGGTNNPGLLTSLSQPVAYAVYTPYLSGNMLTFYYDNQFLSRPGAMSLNARSDTPAWSDYKADVQYVDFDASFAKARRKSTYEWFAGMTNLVRIYNLQYLNTSMVSNMGSMFQNCKKLTELDLTGFSTHASDWVLYTQNMFSGCSSLTRIYVSEGLIFPQSASSNSQNMFAGCVNLVGNGKEYDDTSRDGTMATVKGYLSYAPYACIDENADTMASHTLVFYCDGRRSERVARGYLVYSLPTTNDRPANWWLKNEEIRRVVFDASFASVRPSSTSYWFYQMERLVTVDGTRFLNLSNVTSMDHMFEGCTELMSITDGVSDWDLSAVTSMNSTFKGCSSLRTLDVSKWNTSAVTNMLNLFNGCSQLKTLDLTGWDTYQVRNMAGMFSKCSSLTTLDLTSFNMHWAQKIGSMFSGCSALKTIYIGSGWVLPAQNVSSTDMFSGCEQLVGGGGTTYNSSYVDAARAHADGEGGQPGYLSYVPYTVISQDGKTMTFYCDGHFADHSGEKAYEISYDFTTEQVWRNDVNNVTTVVFDASFEHARPTTMYYWFSGMTALTTIEGMKYLHTDATERMDGLFWACSSLTELDLIRWNTGKLTVAANMFTQCTNLKTIYVGAGWNTDNLQEAEGMFMQCDNLVGGAGTTVTGENWGKEYARVDGGTENPGYLTGAPVAPYAILSSNGTLTFYYDDQRTAHLSQGNTDYDLNTGTDAPGWKENAKNVTTVVFDASFANCLPTSTCQWFCEMENLTTITGMKENLNTSEVTTMYRMFEKCSSLTAIDLSGFNTLKVTSMGSMFDTCKALTSLDVSGFMTDNVTDFSSMFNYCVNLAELDVSHFKTNSARSMAGMFWNCRSLTSLDVSHFNTAKVMSMRNMFNTCWNLTSIDVAGFDVSNVVYFDWMFANCFSLLELDLRTWDTWNGMNMENMFTQCSSLTTIYGKRLGGRNQTGMFSGCTSIRGGRGTTYDASHVDGDYACADGLNGNPGYLTGSYMAYLSPDSTTLTFADFNYVHPEGYAFAAEYAVPDDGTVPEWFADMRAAEITTVVFDPSFALARPRSMESWFHNLSQLTSLKGMENLNTSETENMSFLFAGCGSLKGLDLSTWNTAKVRSMTSMFLYCGALKTVYVGDSWNTDNVEFSTEMFTGCTSLVGGAGTTYSDENRDKTYARIDVAGAPGYFTNRSTATLQAYAEVSADGSTLSFYWDEDRQLRGGTTYDLPWTEQYPGWTSEEGNNLITKAVFDESFADYDGLTSTNRMFYGLTCLSEIEHLNYLNTEQVTDMGRMFSNCQLLTAIDLSMFNTSNVTNMESMFFCCASLPSLDLSTFDTGQVTDMSLMFVNCTSLTGLDLTKFNTENVTMMAGMFWQCEKLETVDLSSFNTANVTDMNGMFRGCTALAVLDLRNFDVSNLYDASYMFQDCSSLTTIYNNDNWQTSRLASTDMFTGCEKLKGRTTNVYTWYAYSESYVNDASLANPSFYFVGEPMAYAMLSNNGTELMFRYDVDRYMYAQYDDTEVFDMTWENFPGWYDLRDDIRSVTIDPSFKNYSGLTSTKCMFYGLGNMTQIDGLENLNTENVTDMSSMFQDCSSLKSLDVSTFKTENVTNMLNMFCQCDNLEQITGLNAFNTANVEYMDGMFAHDLKLTMLDVSSFDVSKVMTMDMMFYNCPQLMSIYCPNSWSDVSSTSENMFSFSESLVGAIPYDGTKTDRQMANPTTGYFTDKIAYAVYNDGTLTFYYDRDRATRTGTTYELNTGDNKPGWTEYNRYAKKVVFDSSFAAALPTSTAHWFDDFSAMTSIEGMENLITSNVTNMAGMFNWCTELTSIDLSLFNTDKVTDMSEMFYYCKALTSLDVTGFNTENVTNMNGMFYGCKGLTSLNVSGFNTENVTSMSSMFSGCEGLTSLDVSVFNTSNVENMMSMFSGCQALTSLDLSGFNTSNVEDMRMMFSHCRSLTELDLSNFDTRNVMSMNDMFGMYEDDNSQLKTLDLSSFDVSNVMMLDRMFRNNQNLTTIYAGNWTNQLTEEAKQNSNSLFMNCTSLVGGKGTTYVNSDETGDIGFAHIDGGTSNPGYFSGHLIYRVGDVNMDGSITIADVTALVNIILGKTTDDSGLADVNGDGNVTIADVKALTSIILGKE